MSDMKTDPRTWSTADIEAERLRRKREVALGYRIFASLRWGDLGDGHITARDPEHTDCMWLLRYPLGFEQATVDDLVLVRADGTTVDGRPINTTAHHIHHPIHAARPDVVGVAHTHTPWGTPFCATGRGLAPITQEACQFYERWSMFDDEEVQIRGVAGGQRIAAALGSNQAALLRSHGLLTVGSSVAETITAFVTLERVTEAHMKAPDATPISDASARVARGDLLAGNGQRVSFEFLVQRHVGDRTATAGSPNNHIRSSRHPIAGRLRAEAGPLGDEGRLDLAAQAASYATASIAIVAAMSTILKRISPPKLYAGR